MGIALIALLLLGATFGSLLVIGAAPPRLRQDAPAPRLLPAGPGTPARAPGRRRGGARRARLSLFARHANSVTLPMR